MSLDWGEEGPCFSFSRETAKGMTYEDLPTHFSEPRSSHLVFPWTVYGSSQGRNGSCRTLFLPWRGIDCPTYRLTAQQSSQYRLSLPENAKTLEIYSALKSTHFMRSEVHVLGWRNSDYTIANTAAPPYHQLRWLHRYLFPVCLQLVYFVLTT